MRPGVRLAVDVGSVRVGVARCDPSGFLASPVVTLRRGRGDLDDLVRLTHEHEAVEVVVGLPVSLSGRESSSAAGARAYAGDLARRVGPVPVRLVDERLSTVTATGALRASGVRGRRTREVVDQAAAVEILQAAIDAERATGKAPGELVVVGPETDETDEKDEGQQ